MTNPGASASSHLPASTAAPRDQLADAMPQLVWIANHVGEVEYYNERVHNYAGIQLEDGTWRWQPLVHDDDVAGTAEAWAAAAASRTEYEYQHRIRMADGSFRWHLSRALPVTEADGRVRWYGTATDVHDLHEAREALARTQAGLGLAMRGGRMGWWSRDVMTNQVTWSRELEEIVGLEPGAFAGNEAAFYELVHPADRELVAAAVDRALETGDDYVVEFRYRHADGTLRWMEGRGRAVYEEGQPTWLFGLGIDVTERKRADELRDIFLGMLSHELRTPVTAIYGGSQLLLRDGLRDSVRQEVTADVVAEAERLERLVENLLVLARVERNAQLGGRDPVLLRPLVRQVIDAERRSRPTAVVNLAVTADVPPALGDEPSVELCVRNLVSNALKYGPPDGPVDVTVTSDATTVRITVGDRGPGIEPGREEQIFELFFRTEVARRAASGAGIGLYVVRALAEAMGGRATARNRQGGGAELTMELPVFREAPAP